MIKSIVIENFRCFNELKINNCRRINIIVGENGTGKTALLEAIFLALGHSPELILRLRQQRGLSASLSGAIAGIEEAIWKDFFFSRDWAKEASIRLTGDGPEARSLTLRRGSMQQAIPLDSEKSKDELATSPICMVWRDAVGKDHTSYPKITSKGLEFEARAEDLPDFFMFPANQHVGASETAQRFSSLSRKGKIGDFINIWTKEFPWIENLSIEMEGGAAAIYASVRGQKEKIPLANISGAINRFVAVLLAMSSRENAVVLVDEIENGTYYKHQAAMWRALLSIARTYGTQLFLTTHSEEWLRSLIESASGYIDEIALWRMERSGDGPVLHSFVGKKVIAGIEAGEVR